MEQRRRRIGFVAALRFWAASGTSQQRTTGAAAATAGLDVTRLNVEVATASAYLDLVTAEQLLVIARANLDRLQVFANAVHVLVDNQLRPGADAAQADADLAVGKTQLIQANTNVVVRRAALADFVGIPTANLEVEDAHLLAAEPGEQSSPAALATHPLAQQEAALVNQRQAQLSVITHSYVPQFNTLASTLRPRHRNRTEWTISRRNEWACAKYVELGSGRASHISCVRLLFSAGPEKSSGS